MAIGAVLYALLQFVLIGAIDPANIKNGWLKPLGTSVSAYGAWYTLALAVGAGWLAKVLLIDAVISPAGTGIVYVGTTARLSYALGEEREMPSALKKTNAQGVPIVGILVAAVIGCVAFGPFKSWKELVEVVTAATAIMYAFAPLSLAALHRLDPNRPRTYRAPAPKILLPAAFCSANLIIYWGGFATTWKLAVAMVVGFVLFLVGAARAGTLGDMKLKSAVWMFPWLGGHVALGALGRYGGGYNVLGEWIDIAAVIAFSLAIFYTALRMTLTAHQTAAAIAKDSYQLDFEAPSHDA
jgi:amino acid transporter